MPAHSVESRDSHTRTLATLWRPTPTQDALSYPGPTRTETQESSLLPSCPPPAALRQRQPVSWWSRPAIGSAHRCGARCESLICLRRTLRCDMSHPARIVGLRGPKLTTGRYRLAVISYARTGRSRSLSLLRGRAARERPPWGDARARWPGDRGRWSTGREPPSHTSASAAAARPDLARKECLMGWGCGRKP